MPPVFCLGALLAVRCLAASDDVALFQGSVQLREELNGDRPRRRRHRRGAPEEEPAFVTSRDTVEQFGVASDAESSTPPPAVTELISEPPKAAEALKELPEAASQAPKVADAAPEAAKEAAVSEALEAASDVPKASTASDSPPREGSQNVSKPSGPYEAGESAEVLDTSSGASAGDWVACTIKARGSVPGTFDIHIAAAPEGQQNFSNVPGKFLRRPDPNAPRRAFFSYDVGEDVEVKAVSGPAAGGWVPASISSKGPLPETYGIHLPLGAPGKQELASVPASYLRKLDKAKLSESTKNFALSPENALDMSMRKEFRDTWLAEELRHMANAYTSPPSFSEGEAAEIQIPEGPMRGGWAPCTVLGSGEKERTYNVRVPSAGDVVVPVHMLRKLRTTAPPEEYKVGEVAEVQVKDGPHQGDWVKVSVLRSGSKSGLYDLSTGFEEIHDIPAAGLRKVVAADSAK